ncbi:DNA repair protein RecO [bacterium]|nr:DNA repair protein RecO [bacterium]
MEHQISKTEAIVIRERELGEADKLFTLYTKDLGKIEVLGKGIRKIKAKLKGGLQILNYISVEFVEGKNFYIATDAILKNSFSVVKSNIKKFRSGLYIAVLMDKLLKGQEKDNKIWNLFLKTLNTLSFYPCYPSDSDSFNFPIYSLILRYFEWNLVSLLGLKPELYYCLGCESKIKTGKFFFSAREGGILDQRCKDKDKKAIEISRDSIKVLRLIISQKEEILKRLRINPIQERELKEISRFFLSWILGEEVFVV